MPNTRSAKKALRQSNRKKTQNLFWKKRLKDVLKSVRKHLDTESLNIDIMKKEQSEVYKVVDKAAKNKVIHKNKAQRIKSSISKKIIAHEKSAPLQKQSSKKPTAGGSKSASKSKSKSS